MRKRAASQGVARLRSPRATRAAEESAQFELAQEVLGIVTWIWNVVDERIDWLGDIAGMLGLEDGAFSGRFQDYERCVHPDDRARARATLVACLRGEISQYRTEERVVWPDGTEHWLETYGRAMLRKDGRTQSMAGVIKDITPRKRQEEELRRVEARFSKIFDASPDYMLIARKRDGRVVAANRAFGEFAGYASAELPGKTTLELGVWDNPGERDRMVEALRERGEVRDMTITMRDRQGRRMSGSMSAAVIEHDGEPHIVSVVHDVSEVRQLKQERRQAEQKFLALFETSPESIVLTRLSDGTVLEVNRTWERVSGVSREQVRGRSAIAFGSWVSMEQREAIIAQLEREGSVSNAAVRFKRADGKLFDALVSVARIELEGETCGLWSWRDVSEMRAIEHRLRQSERKFSALFETSPEPIALTSFEDGSILEVNEAWCRTLGHAREAALGNTGRKLGIWKDIEVRDTLAARVREQGRVSNYPAQLVRRDGSLLDVLVSASEVEFEGRSCGLWSWRDVSKMREIERRLRQSEHMFSALFENSPEAVTLYRISDGIRLAANAQWEKASGYKRADAIGRPASNVSMFRDPVARAAFLSRAEKEGGVVNGEAALTRADGSDMQALISGAIIEVDGERCMLWCWRDITEERKVERAQKLADSRYRALFEAAVDGMMIGSADGTILDVNPALCKRFGRSPEELVGRNFVEFMSSSDLAARPPRADRATRWGRVERMVPHKDGRELPTEAVAGPMPDGNILSILRDITERKRNEALVMNIARGVSASLGEAFFRSLVEHLGRELGADFAFVGEIVEPARARIRTRAFVAEGEIAPNFEYALEGSPCRLALERRGTVVYPERVAALFPDDVGLAKRGVEGYVGTSLYASDGTPLGILVVMSRKPVEHSAFWAPMIEIFGARAAAELERSRADSALRQLNETLDQKVRDRTAELEEANQELDSYNFSVSHDLRQPLNAIAGFSELLRETIDPGEAGEALEYATEIETNAARMEQMIGALFEFSRAGRGEVARVPVDMKGAVDSVLRDLGAGGAPRAEISVGNILPARGDATLLRQVWINLIGNAIKYSGKAERPRVSIESAHCGDSIEYSVRDNGVGFDSRHAERLFGVFQRLPSSSGFEGSGVGLAIVQRILKRHGGSVRAESSPGQGATFRFTLPAL